MCKWFCYLISQQSTVQSNFYFFSLFQSDCKLPQKHFSVYKNLSDLNHVTFLGTALLAISGEPNVEGVTIDTAAQDQKVIDRWANGKKDVSLKD